MTRERAKELKDLLKDLLKAVEGAFNEIVTRCAPPSPEPGIASGPEIPWLCYFLVLVDHRRTPRGFERLLELVGWKRKLLEKERLLEIKDDEWEVVVTITALRLAWEKAAPQAEHHWPSIDACRLLLDVWSQVRTDVTRHRVMAPEVLGAYMTGAWWPPGQPRLVDCWEPGRLTIEAITYEIVKIGCVQLARRGLPPLDTEIRGDEFISRVVSGTNFIAPKLLAAQQRASERMDLLAKKTRTLKRWGLLAKKTRASERLECWWDFQSPRDSSRSLWGFISNAILGSLPKGASAADRRPDPRPLGGEFNGTWLGCWLESACGMTARVVERRVCLQCGLIFDKPDGHEDHPTVWFFTRNRIVTTREGPGPAGWWPVRRGYCKNPECHIVCPDHSPINARPIFSITDARCPLCGIPSTFWRTVWTRFR